MISPGIYTSIEYRVLLFIPSSTRRQPTTRDTISYDLSRVDKIDTKHLAKFILHNAGNPNTLLKFLSDFTTSSKLRHDLINLVASKQNRLEKEINKLDHLIRNQSTSTSRFIHDLDYYLKFKLNSLNLELDILRNFTTFF